jgi:type III pantothenate kinase
MHNSPYLLIDIGNTFVKWGRYRAGGAPGVPASEMCTHFGRVLLDEVSSLSTAWRDDPPPKLVVVSNVAGTRVRNPLLRALEVWPDSLPKHWITSQPAQCGVKNGYLNPAQLGSDRWAAMVGARALVGDRAALVAVCGTATTIDLLTSDGEFVGGAIMPGQGLMQRVLHEQTAALPDAQGEYVDYPRQTVDAIASGCAHAQAGAVERLYYQHKRNHPDLVCVISGGAATTLAPRLTIAYQHVENLVLEGLYRIAESLAEVR